MSIEIPKQYTDLYRVKAVSKKGKVIFGIVNACGPEAEALFKLSRSLELADSITGLLYHVPVDQFRFTNFPMTWEKTDPDTGLDIGNEYDDRINDAYKKAIAIDEAAGPGVQKGKLCFLPVADGAACYEVTKVNKKTCRVAWRSYGGPDNYVDHRWGYRSTVPIEQVQRFCQN